MNYLVFFTRISSYRSIAVEPLKFTGFGATGIGDWFCYNYLSKTLVQAAARPNFESVIETSTLVLVCFSTQDSTARYGFVEVTK